MQPTLSDSPTVICSMSGVHLNRYGPPDDLDTTYLVIEPDHVATFSRLSSTHPLRNALEFFIDRANWRYHTNADNADRTTTQLTKDALLYSHCASIDNRQLSIQTPSAS